MLLALLTLVHFVVCLILIVVVLLQTGKRADLAGAFGGGGSQTAFGARGAATFLSKATTISAVLFMVTSLALALLYSHREGAGSVLDTVPAPLSSTPSPLPSPPESPPPSPSPSPAESPAPPPSNP